MYVIDPSVDELPNADFKFLLKKWNDIKAAGRLPKKADFPPQEMVHILPKIMIIDIIHNPLNEDIDCKFRLVGTAITQALDVDPTGKYLSDIPNDPETIKRIKTSVDTKTPYIKYTNRHEWFDNSYKNYDGLCLPLSSDGETINQLMILFNIDR